MLTRLISILNLAILNLKSVVLLNTSSGPARCSLVSVSIFVALVCSTSRGVLLVVDSTVSTFFCFVLNTSSPSACCSVVCGGYLKTYLRLTGTCKQLSSLPTEFPSAHVLFTRAFGYFDLFLIAFNSDL